MVVFAVILLYDGLHPAKVYPTLLGLLGAVAADPWFTL